jgi:zinc transporter ZupT
MGRVRFFTARLLRPGLVNKLPAERAFDRLILNLLRTKWAFFAGFRLFFRSSTGFLSHLNIWGTVDRLKRKSFEQFVSLLNPHKLLLYPPLLIGIGRLVGVKPHSHSSVCLNDVILGHGPGKQ